MSSHAAALGWLAKAIGWFRKARRKARRHVIKLKGYLADLRALEQETPAELEVWKAIAAAAEAGASVSISIEGAKYLHEFKSIWNRRVRTPLQRLARWMTPGD